jgi:hypothetical protein
VVGAFPHQRPDDALLLGFARNGAKQVDTLHELFQPG